MKKNIFILLLSFIITTPTFSQNLKGILVQRFISAMGDDSNLTAKQSKPNVFSYTYSKKKSIQKLISEDKSSIDTTYTEKHGVQLPTENVIISPSNQCFYKDFDADIYKMISTTNKKDLSIKDKLLNTFKWTLINETREIGGYKCKKATTINSLYGMELSIIAWYCEDITINDGPMNYSGLPGFIIQIEVGKYTTFTFENLVFSKDEIEIIEPKNSAQDITFKQRLINKSIGK